MSSTEPPSRIPPRQQPQDTKVAREELSSKGKVEKVREVDPDEETRKKRFLKYYKDQDLNEETEERPSPFDLYSQKPDVTDKKRTLGKPPSFGDIEDAAVPGPGSTSPPDLGSQPPQKKGMMKQAAELCPNQGIFGMTLIYPINHRPLLNFSKFPVRLKKLPPLL